MYSALLGQGLGSPTFLDGKGSLLSDEQSPILRAARGERFTVMFQVCSADGATARYEAMGHPVAMVSGPRLGVVTIRPFPDPDGREVAGEQSPA